MVGPTPTWIDYKPYDAYGATTIGAHGLQVAGPVYSEAGFDAGQLGILWQFAMNTDWLRPTNGMVSRGPLFIRGQLNSSGSIVLTNSPDGAAFWSATGGAGEQMDFDCATYPFPSVTNLTCNFLTRMTTNNNMVYPVMFGPSDYNGPFLFYFNQGNLISCFRVYGATNYASALCYTNGMAGAATNCWADNRWHDVTGTYDGAATTNNVLFYVDGVLVASNSFSGALHAGTNLFYFGGGNNTALGVANVRIWQRTLGASEIQNIAARRGLAATNYGNFSGIFTGTFVGASSVPSGLVTNNSTAGITVTNGSSVGNVGMTNGVIYGNIPWCRIERNWRCTPAYNWPAVNAVVTNYAAAYSNSPAFGYDLASGYISNLLAGTYRITCGVGCFTSGGGDQHTIIQTNNAPCGGGVAGYSAVNNALLTQLGSWEGELPASAIVNVVWKAGGNYSNYWLRVEKTK